MSDVAAVSGRSGEVAAARLLLDRMGLSSADLVAADGDGGRPAAPTFAQYVPVVAAAVTDGTRRAYRSYWNRLVELWGERRIDEPTVSQTEQLVEQNRGLVVVRRNARGGRSC